MFRIFLSTLNCAFFYVWCSKKFFKFLLSSLLLLLWSLSENKCYKRFSIIKFKLRMILQSFYYCILSIFLSHSIEHTITLACVNNNVMIFLMIISLNEKELTWRTWMGNLRALGKNMQSIKLYFYSHFGVKILYKLYFWFFFVQKIIKHDNIIYVYHLVCYCCLPACLF